MVRGWNEEIAVAVLSTLAPPSTLSNREMERQVYKFAGLTPKLVQHPTLPGDAQASGTARATESPQQAFASLRLCVSPAFRAEPDPHAKHPRRLV